MRIRTLKGQYDLFFLLSGVLCCGRDSDCPVSSLSYCRNDAIHHDDGEGVLMMESVV